MKYDKICKGKFIERPNRFVAVVEIDGKTVEAHVKNTGRCKELLIPDATVYLEDFDGRMGTRRIRYSLIGVKKGNVLINMDAQAPNKVCEEALLSGKLSLPEMGLLTDVKREKTYGSSRFDFFVRDEHGRVGWLEVKGVTLEEKGVARFPDAPTERGVKHVEELIRAIAEGYNGYILFVIQMPEALYFQPNDQMHRAFGDALRKAVEAGVHVMAWSCIVREDALTLKEPVKILL